MVYENDSFPLKRWMRFQTILRGLSAGLDYYDDNKRAVVYLTKADSSVTITFRADFGGCIIKNDGCMYVSEAVLKSCFYNVLNYLPVGSERLKNLDWFFINPDNNNDYYHIGGNQAWMRGSLSMSGCGPAAGANILFYLGKKQSEYFAGTSVSHPIPKQHDYNEYMKQIFYKMNAFFFGVYDIHKFMTNVIDFGKANNMRLTSKWKKFIPKETTLNEAVSFIVSGLKNDCPVAILTRTLPWRGGEVMSLKYPGSYNDELNTNPIKVRYAYHWMTIVELVKTPNAVNDYTVRALTWGTTADLKLSDYFDTDGRFKTNQNLSVMYFVSPTVA